MPDTTQNQARAALITGAGRRIGRAIALTLSHAGYALALHANRSRGDAEALAGEIAKTGGRAAVVLGDLADVQAVGGIVCYQNDPGCVCCKDGERAALN